MVTRKNRTHKSSMKPKNKKTLKYKYNDKYNDSKFSRTRKIQSGGVEMPRLKLPSFSKKNNTRKRFSRNVTDFVPKNYKFNNHSKNSHSIEKAKFGNDVFKRMQELYSTNINHTTKVHLLKYQRNLFEKWRKHPVGENNPITLHIATINGKRVYYFTDKEQGLVQKLIKLLNQKKNSSYV